MKIDDELMMWIYGEDEVMKIGRYIYFCTYWCRGTDYDVAEMVASLILETYGIEWKYESCDSILTMIQDAETVCRIEFEVNNYDEY